MKTDDALLAVFPYVDEFLACLKTLKEEGYAVAKAFSPVRLPEMQDLLTPGAERDPHAYPGGRRHRRMRVWSAWRSMPISASGLSSGVSPCLPGCHGWWWLLRAPSCSLRSSPLSPGSSRRGCPGPASIPGTTPRSPDTNSACSCPLPATTWKSSKGS